MTSRFKRREKKISFFVWDSRIKFRQTVTIEKKQQRKEECTSFFRIEFQFFLNAARKKAGPVQTVTEYKKNVKTGIFPKNTLRYFIFKKLNRDTSGCQYLVLLTDKIKSREKLERNHSWSNLVYSRFYKCHYIAAVSSLSISCNWSHWASLPFDQNTNSSD